MILIANQNVHEIILKFHLSPSDCSTNFMVIFAKKKGNMFITHVKYGTMKETSTAILMFYAGIKVKQHMDHFQHFTVQSSHQRGKGQGNAGKVCIVGQQT